MRKQIAILTLLPFILAGTCNPGVIIEDVASLDVHLHATYDGNPLIMNNTQSYAGNMGINFESFSYYISDMVLLAESNTDETEILEIDLMDYSGDITQELAEAGQSLRFNSLPVGNYLGVRFSVGVPADLNKTLTSEYSPEHPLNRDDLYWEELNSYVFTEMSGQLDTDNNGDFDVNFSYKTGSDDLYRSVTLLAPVSLVKDESAQINISIDMLKILKRGNVYLNIAETPTIDDPADLTTAIYLMDNIKTAFSIE